MLHHTAVENASPITSAKSADNRCKNRYTDVLPFDETRVKLSGDDDYINACYVSPPFLDQKYICCQGPLRNTCYDFWKMVWEQDCSIVVMLNKIIENNMLKCHPYWPSGEIDEDGDSDDEVVLNELKINFVSKEFFEFYTISKLRISNSAVDQSKDILHFHYHAWPDFGVPESPTMFLTFLNAVRQYYKQSKGPPVVHCSAGIGRTGTLILVDVILKLIEEKQTNNIDVFSILLHLRKHRLGLVQTPDQLRFCFLSILQGAEKFRTENFRDTYIRAPMSDLSDSSSGSVEYFYRQGDSDNSEEATDDDVSLDDEMEHALPDSIEDEEETKESSEEDLDLSFNAVSPKEVVTGENGMFSEGEEGEGSRPVSESHDLDLPTDGIGSVSPIANDFFELPDDIIVSRKSKKDEEKPVPESEPAPVEAAPMKNSDLQDILSMKEPVIEMNDIMLTEDKPEILPEPMFTSAEPLIDSNLTATEVDGPVETSEVPTNDIPVSSTETTKKRLSSSDDNSEIKKRKQNTADLVAGMKARLNDHEAGTESKTYYWETFGKPLLVGSLAAAGLSFIVYLVR